MTYREKLASIEPIIEELIACGDGEMFVDLQGYRNDDRRISYFPPESGKSKAVQVALKYTGKIKKDNNGNVEGRSSGLQIAVFGVLSCKIIGHKKIKRDVMQKVGEEEVETPIYDCRLPFEEVPA